MLIQTKRLIIRPFRFANWQNVLAYTSNQEVMHFLPEEVFTEEVAKQFVQEHAGGNAKQFAVTIRETN
ncbi:RimJ/RimL family protein N-acetyltransferase [Alkalicoccobacillus murimartini]|uniref:RimJ/RimL family protein N-acetyltransferase n=1 Tax=Alkalicoccobacillus murimartini TaxID=171685 RepID=A0ABT9YGP4_9BACI|nr:RimJ/RimL family protein N-acetyltransferase [Alkalicoccobacillus murimartini]